MIRCLALFALVTLCAACAQTVVPPPKSANYYLEEGERLFEKELYEDAIATWEKVRDSYYSAEVSTEAELKIAEAHFLADNYIEAALSYENFLKNHPGHPREGDIIFQLGLSYYRQVLSADRDQSATRSAKATLRNFLTRFAGHPKTEEARTVISQCNERLAAHEIYVGRFYLRTEKYQAAINRLEPVPALYPGTSQLDRAWYYLGLAHLRSGDRQAAAAAFNSLFENFPASPFIEKGQKVLSREF